MVVGLAKWTGHSLPLLFIFEGVLIEKSVDDHGPGEVIILFLTESVEGFFEESFGFI